MLFNHVQSNSEHIYIYINDFPRLLAIKKTGHFLHSASAPATAAPEHRASCVLEPPQEMLEDLTTAQRAVLEPPYAGTETGRNRTKWTEPRPLFRDSFWVASV